MITLISMILAIIGAINWGLIGVCDFNLVAWICAQNIIAQRVIYSLVGVAGLWMIAYLIFVRGRVGIVYSNKEQRKKLI